MQKYGLIGYPLKHSFSIGYFNEKFKAENIDAEYVNFEIPRIEDFPIKNRLYPTSTNWIRTPPRLVRSTLSRLSAFPKAKSS